jgi:hypothetical protein
LHLDLQENPPRGYHNFEKLICVGPQIIGGEGNIETENNEIPEVSIEDNEEEV